MAAGLFAGARFACGVRLRLVTAGDMGGNVGDLLGRYAAPLIPCVPMFLGTVFGSADGSLGSWKRLVLISGNGDSASAL